MRCYKYKYTYTFLLLIIILTSLSLVMSGLKETFDMAVPSQKRTTLVIYSYYEKNNEYIKNFAYFLKHAIYDDVDYIFYINGHTCSIDIPTQTNIRVILRDNMDYDFGAYDDAVNNIPLDSYEYFFFINTSVRGPFILSKDGVNVRWMDPFMKLLTGDVKLVGTTINIFNASQERELNLLPLTLLTNKGWTPPFSHVQSQIFLIDKEALLYLKSVGFFSQPPERNFITFIILHEVMMSQLILKKGWNIDCLLPKYQGLDYRILTKDINPTSIQGDPYVTGAYFGGTIRPYDVVFIKTNRNVSTDEIEKLSLQ